MWKHLESELFGLLSDASEVTNEEMKNAYGHFIEQVKAVGDSDDYTGIYRRLNFIRIEFDALGASPLYGKGKKCPEIGLSPKIYTIH